MKHRSVKQLIDEESKKEKVLKPVRIDSKTVIMVDENIPDEEARERFFIRLTDNSRRFDNQKADTRWK